jgi:hypothetical protein
MMKRSMLGTLLAALAVAGCAEMKELDDWALKKAREDRQPATGTPAASAAKFNVPSGAQCAFNPGYPESANCCILSPYMSSLDMDTALARAVQEFQYPTKISGRGRDPNPSRLYRFMTYPGQLHDVANDVRPRSDASLAQGLWLKLRIEPGVDKHAHVELAYCETPGLRAADQVAWHKAVQNAIYTTVPPLQARRQ